MGKKTPATTTTVNKTELDPMTQQWQSALFNNGMNLYNQGPPEYYPGSTVAPYTQQTEQGLGMMEQQASQGAVGLPQAQQAMQRGMSGFMPGFGTAMQASQGGMQNPWAASLFNTSQQQVTPQISGQIAGAAGMGQQLAQAGQTPTTMGVSGLESFDGGANNPFLDQMFNSGANKVRDQLNARFAQSGRSGPNAAYGAAYGGALGDLYTGIYAPAYESAQDRRLAASNSLAGIDQGNRAAAMQGLSQGAGIGLGAADMMGSYLSGDIGRQYQGASDLAGLSESGFGRQLQGAELGNNMFSQSNADAARSASMLPSLYQYGGMPAEQMLSVGGAHEQMNQSMLDADIQRWNYGQNANWDQLTRLSGLMSGMPGAQTSTQTTTAPQASSNRGMSLLGGLSGAAGLGSMLGMGGAAATATAAATAMNPMMWPLLIGGGLLGAFG